jgi:creatinine amidohydrolase/Fe(II)-dependent formamide hydrolase-like protein
LSEAQIGRHAGTADTSLLMAIDGALVRTEQMAAAASAGAASGAVGDPRASNAALGEIGVELIVAQTVAAIRSAQDSRR